MRGPTWFAQKAGRRDANHASIRDGLRKLGHFVVDTGGVGDGVPDLLVYPRDALCFAGIHGGCIWLELKVATGKLRESQTSWRMSAERRGVRVSTVRTLGEALKALGNGRQAVPEIEKIRAALRAAALVVDAPGIAEQDKTNTNGVG